MIDWTALVTNTLWLLALSIALAITGWASWQAAQEETRFQNVLRRRGYARALQGCLALFCLGVALSVHSTWERAAWALLTLVAMVQLVLSARNPDEKTQARKEKE